MVSKCTSSFLKGNENKIIAVFVTGFEAFVFVCVWFAYTLNITEVDVCKFIH